jgi:hypothetical protein
MAGEDLGSDSAQCAEGVSALMKALHAQGLAGHGRPDPVPGGAAAGRLAARRSVLLDLNLGRDGQGDPGN